MQHKDEITNEKDMLALRSEIDGIDDQMMQLFEQRMAVSKQVGEYKRKHNLPVFDPEREQFLLQDKANKLKDLSLREPCITFFQTVMNVSKEAQTEIIAAPKLGRKVAYQGIPGAFSEQAAIEYFEADARKIYCKSFEDVFAAVHCGKVEQGIVPIENSTGGSIDEIYDYLEKYQCYMVGEHIVTAEQTLLAPIGAKIENIKTVYSHEQGFLQCSEFLAKHDFQRVVYTNTATSAQYVAQLGDLTVGAIASQRNAQIYGLDILQRGINNKKNNFTRFVAIAKNLNLQQQKTKASLAFNLKHECGSLYAVLAHLAKRGFSLTKIESHNIPDKPFEYRFYIDLEGALDGQGVQTTISELRGLALDIRLMGYYDPFMV